MMSEDVNPELEFNCSVCKKPSTFDKEITFVGSLPGKLGPTSVHLCNPCSKNNHNMTLKDMVGIEMLVPEVEKSIR